MNREWMYRRFTSDGYISPEFHQGLESFIQFACGQPAYMDGNKIRCPCRKCKNLAYREVDTVRLHISSKGFMFNYHVWSAQGERQVMRERPKLTGSSSSAAGTSQYHQMVIGVAAGSRFNMDNHLHMDEDIEEPPNPEAQKFYDMLRAADKELWPGCSKHSQLSLVARMINLKFENNIPEKCFDGFAELMKEIVPDDNLVPDNFYKTKRLLRGMGLPVQKIDCCYHNCMLYWKDDIELDHCRICQYPRYDMRNKKRVAKKRMYYFPLTPRLQRLYASNATAAHMHWHASSVDDGVMRHPADSPAWKHLNNTFPDFGAETRNVRLGLSLDGFQPFGQTGKQYSSWTVVLTPYNLPPSMCMKEQFMFLTVLVPGPQNPKEKLDVFLQPLIEELCELWFVGVTTYDISKKHNFVMRAALMWTISDFSAYSMLSGWSTAGRLACPHCKESTDAFTLSCSGKQSWFDNHRKFLPPDHVFRRNIRGFLKNRVVLDAPPEMKTGVEILDEIESFGLRKVTEPNNNASISKSSGCGWNKRSIFWDLPYWSSLLIRHNLDVMHIEKNVFDNVFNTILNVKGKTKDTTNSRKELNQFCHRPELKGNEHTGEYPKPCYTLDRGQMPILFEWMKELKFPDGYVSNMSRCVDMRKMKLFGMKSHDCHVFMQRILPIAFRELLPTHVWKAITELSIFFRDLCCRNIKMDDACRLHTNIPIILCQLERIFPPSFFDSMEHLPVHLADEVRLAGPVQYRWMYPFERYLGKLKKTHRNKARVEGSICNSYLVQEASSFCSFYFEDHINTRYRNVPRNFSGPGEHSHHPDMLPIFKQSARPFGKASDRWLTDVEYQAIKIYALMNCAEVEQYIKIFVDELTLRHPNLTIADFDTKLNLEFSSWFANYACNPGNNLTQIMQDFAKGPAQRVRCYPGCFVNGYKFHRVTYSSNRAIVNSGVCVKGTTYSSSDSDYYGRLLEVIELEYPGLPIKKAMFFKCEWFDGSNVGTHVHPVYKLVSVNHKKKYYKGDDAFVLACQAVQVFYCSYPSSNRSKIDWWAVCKTQARSIFQVPPQATDSVIPPPLQEDELEHVDIILVDEQTPTLSDDVVIELEEEDEEEDEGEDIEFSDHYSTSDSDDELN